MGPYLPIVDIEIKDEKQHEYYYKLAVARVKDEGLKEKSGKWLARVWEEIRNVYLFEGVQLPNYFHLQHLMCATGIIIPSNTIFNFSSNRISRIDQSTSDDLPF